MSSIQVRQVNTGSQWRILFNLPSRLYRDDPNYVEPLRADLRNQFNPAKNSFFKHGELQPWLAYREGRPVGSILAVHNQLYNNYHRDKAGFFMSFECENDPEAAGRLFSAAEEWLRSRGLETAVGPMSFSGENVSPGLLISGFEHPPFLLMAHHLPYYQALVEGAGYEKAIDALAFSMPIQQEMDPRLVRLAGQVGRTRNIKVRFFDNKNFWRDARILFDIYCKAWADNWGFVPPSEEDFMGIVKSLKQIYIPSLVQIAERDGEPVGWAMTLPNINEALIHMNGRLLPFGIFKFMYWMKRVKGLRLWGLGILPAYRSKGVDVMLYYHTLKEGKRLGYTNGELSWILETNSPVVNAAHLVRGTEYKRYRIYKKELL
jgi:GNAT superfamily N-acetyltransferase